MLLTSLHNAAHGVIHGLDAAGVHRPVRVTLRAVTSSTTTVHPHLSVHFGTVVGRVLPVAVRASHGAMVSTVSGLNCSMAVSLC